MDTDHPRKLCIYPVRWKPPLDSVLVKAFRHSDRAVVSEAYTDANGRVELELPSADRYLISGVVIRPDDDPDYDWISHWPTITLEVVN